MRKKCRMCKRFMPQKTNSDMVRRYCKTCSPNNQKKFKEIRESIRERDKYTCQICGKKQGHRALDVHHLNPKQEGKKDYAYDSRHKKQLITVCQKCHCLLKGKPTYQQLKVIHNYSLH